MYKLLGIEGPWSSNSNETKKSKPQNGSGRLLISPHSRFHELDRLREDVRQFPFSCLTSSRYSRRRLAQAAPVWIRRFSNPVQQSASHQSCIVPAEHLACFGWVVSRVVCKSLHSGTLAHVRRLWLTVEILLPEAWESTHGPRLVGLDNFIPLAILAVRFSRPVACLSSLHSQLHYDSGQTGLMWMDAMFVTIPSLPSSHVAISLPWKVGPDRQ